MNRKHNHKTNRLAAKLALAVQALAAVALLIVLAAMIRHTLRQQQEPAFSVAYSTLVPDVTLVPEISTAPAETPVPTAEPTAAPTPEPTPFAYLPVIKKADTDQKRIAITVDDCYQTENLRQIVDLAVDNGAKLTLFPVGENISHTGMAEILRESVYQLGFEIENHTWSHARIFRLSEADMAAEIWKQSRAVSKVLNADYHQHFLRLMGGDGSSDQRTHNYLKQLGYTGIAEWSLSGSNAPLKDIEDSLAPGMIYLFHTTDADTEKLRQFIPWVRAQGYEMVTMNALLGLEENAMTALTDGDMPAPRHYDADYRTHKKGDYAWVIVELQDKLRQMGYLVMDGASTGYYGDQTAAAVAAFQTARGLEPTGEADEETIKGILGIDS